MWNKKARVSKNPGIIIHSVFSWAQTENNMFVQDSCRKHVDHFNHERSFQVCRPLRCTYSIRTGIVCKDKKSITLFSFLPYASSGRIYAAHKKDSGMTRIIAGIISAVGNIFSCRMRKPLAIMTNPPHALKSLIMAGVVSGMI